MSGLQFFLLPFIAIRVDIILNNFSKRFLNRIMRFTFFSYKIGSNLVKRVVRNYLIDNDLEISPGDDWVSSCAQPQTGSGWGSSSDNAQTTTGGGWGTTKDEPQKSTGDGWDSSDSNNKALNDGSSSDNAQTKTGSGREGALTKIRNMQGNLLTLDLGLRYLIMY